MRKRTMARTKYPAFEGGNNRPLKARISREYPNSSISAHILPDERDDKFLHAHARRRRTASRDNSRDDMNASLATMMMDEDELKDAGIDYAATESRTHDKDTPGHILASELDYGHITMPIDEEK